MGMMIMENSRVLVTGGAGFIGSNLCEKLLQQENEVICLDNFATGHRRNIEGFLKNKRFLLIEGDIRNYEDCRRSADGVDYVLHQAALGSVPRSINDPMTSADVNISGFVKMLFASKEAKVKRFVYAASSSTYGDHPDLPKVEEKIGNPLSPYAITKFTNELFAKNFSDIYGIETTGLRYFNVFGPRQDPNGAYAAVIPRWIQLMLQGEQPAINGDGTNSRDFTFVENVVNVNQMAAVAQYGLQANSDMDSRENGSSQKKLTSGRIYNVACGERTDLNQLFIYIRDGLLNHDPGVADIKPIYRSNREGDIPHSLADITKAKKELGYEVAVNVRDGIKRTCEWFVNLKMGTLI